MLKAEPPRRKKSIVSSSNSAASNHLWDDFVNQVSAYARRTNIAYRGIPLNEREQYKKGPAAVAWYNKVKV